MSDCQPGFTAADYLHAKAYAFQQVNYAMCTDQKIIDKICSANPTGKMSGGGGNCLSWRQDEKQKTFPTPNNIYRKSCDTDDQCYLGKCINGTCTCTSDADCGNLNCIPDPESKSQSLVCGFNPSFVAAGHCILNNEKACLAQSDIPYDCSSCGPQGNGDGTCIQKTDSKFPYLEWHKDASGNGKCVMGNFALRQWCENPCSRCAQNSDGSFPPMCKGKDTPGVSDVPPFFYDRNKGNCYLTHDYCDRYGLNYNMGTCQTDADCGDGNFCDFRSGTGRCTGPSAKCYEPTGQKIGEFFLGRTLFYMFKKGTTCGAGDKIAKEFYEEENKDFFVKNLNKVCSEALKDVSEKTCFYYDKKLIKKEKILYKNFAGELDLYIFEKNNNSLQLGFLPEKIKEKFPENVSIHSDDTYTICVSREDAKKDSILKKIYLTLGTSSWILENILSFVKGKKE